MRPIRIDKNRFIVLDKDEVTSSTLVSSST